MPIQAGIPAPDFTLPDDQDQPRSLSDYRGKMVVLYFYPRDDTPGCTKEACGFRNDYSAYRDAGVEILGVSPDDTQSHARFRDKYDLPFPLLADTENEISRLYGVWGVKKIFGRESQGVLRTTFLIDPQGMILQVFEKVRPGRHSAQILEAVTQTG